MKQIQFDFNNMLDSNIGKGNGVSTAAIGGLSGALLRAHRHLKNILSDKESRVRLSLEWANLPFQKAEEVRMIQGLGDAISAKYKNVIFLGIGGSYLGLKAAQDALLPAYYNEFENLRKNRPRIYFEGNNLDPDTLHILLKNLDPKQTFVIVISKSGETTETKAAFDLAEAWLKRSAGRHYGRQVIAITDPSSGALRRRASLENSRDPLSFRSLPLLKGVGGRFSELNMGLLHLAVAGIRIKEVLSGAAAMASRCNASDIYRNPAYMYAALHYLLYRRKGKDIAVLMPFAETLKSTADWYVQLLAESLGKKFARKIKAIGKNEIWENDPLRIVNTGRTPISSRGTNDLHSIQQNNIEGENNKVVTFIRVDDFSHELVVPSSGGFLAGQRYSRLIGLAQEATEWALAREGRANCTIRLPRIDPYYWGGLIFFFEMATAFEGELLGINAFDQPGVEGYKNYLYYKLRKPGVNGKIISQIKSSPLRKVKKFII